MRIKEILESNTHRIPVDLKKIAQKFGNQTAIELGRERNGVMFLRDLMGQNWKIIKDLDQYFLEPDYMFENTGKNPEK